MTFRGTVFLLILYLLLVWILSALASMGEGLEVTVRRGLLWSAVGVGALLVWLLCERVWTWWSLRRLRAPAQPKATPAAAVPPSEDRTAFASLIAEADDRLSKASPPRRFHDYPIYLFAGPAGGGKTSVVQNAGIDAQLLAGGVVSAAAPVASTGVANIWLAHECLFVEISGRIFQGDVARFSDLLTELRPQDRSSGWRKAWNLQASTRPAVSGVVLCADLRSLLAGSEPSRAESVAQATREQLLAIAGAFGIEVPVYAVFTRTDAVPYAAEFFGRLSDSDAGQAFGVLSADSAEASADGRVWTESETKRLSRECNELFLCLNTRRLLALSQEGDSTRKPQIYEFPREFKKIRPSVVQFLVDALRPDRLRSSPRLRGFFFCGVRQVEEAAVRRSDDSLAVPRGDRGSLEATRIFREDPTIYQPAGAAMPRGHLVHEWLFTKGLFQDVLLQDRPTLTPGQRPDRASLRRQTGLKAALAGVACLAGVAWTASWLGNRALVNEARSFVTVSGSTGAGLSVGSLRALDGLRRLLVERLDQPGEWRLNWGLYVGTQLRSEVQKAYFARFEQLLLNDINARLVARLQRVDRSQPYEGVYSRLQTHLTIAGKQCEVESQVVAPTLKETLTEIHPEFDEARRELVDRQVQYYVEALRTSDPVPLKADRPAVDAARRWLSDSHGPEQTYLALLSQVRASAPPVRLSEKVADYQKVLMAPEEVKFEFTKAGRQKFEGLAAENKSFGGKTCVSGVTQGVGAAALDLVQARKMKELYYRAYLDAWKEFLRQTRVRPFSSLADAASKLDVLTGSEKPLLGLLRFVGENTYTPAPKMPEPNTGGFGKALSELGRARVEKAAESAGIADPKEVTPAKVSQVFQPAHHTVPPEAPNLVAEPNRVYLEKLRTIKTSLENLLRAPESDKAALVQQANVTVSDGENIAQNLADGFNKNTDGVDGLVADLLFQPVRFTRSVLPRPDDEINEALRQFCRVMSPTLSKFPFSREPARDITVAELKAVFSPEGLVWTRPWLAKLAVKKGARWEPISGAKPQPSPELIAFLNRAQELTDALFPGAAPEPNLHYDLRPIPGQKRGIRIEIDGTVLDSQSPFQVTFSWPGNYSGASLWGSDSPGSKFPVYQASDICGVFKLFFFADDRPLRSQEIVWSKSGRREVQPLDPPVKVELKSLPGGADIFNPKFFEALKCPGKMTVQ